MKIFLDVDGVFADFDGRMRELVGEYKQHGNEIWEPIGKIDNFFYKLDMLPGCLKLVTMLQHHDLEFLTALPIPTGKLVTADADKRKWLAEHVSRKIKVNTVIGGKNKALYLKDHPRAILIDDYKRNIDVWHNAGGFGILHTSVENTLSICNENGLL